MVKLRPIRLLGRHARAVSAAVQPLHQSYVRHDGIFRGQITRHRQRRQKSAAVPAACALGSAPVSAAIAVTGKTDSSMQSTSSRQSHLCVFSFRFLLDLYFQLYFMEHPSPQHNRDTLVFAANKTVHAHRKKCIKIPRRARDSPRIARRGIRIFIPSPRPP